MKLFAVLVVAAVAQVDYDDMGNKKNKPDKGPRWCENESNKLENSSDGTTIWKCKSRQPG